MKPAHVQRRPDRGNIWKAGFVAAYVLQDVEHVLEVAGCI
jgi:hypothetical protein